jgi:uncharacterized protein YbjT (DUF2867 family)
MTRDPDLEKARALRHAGAEIVRGDLRDAASIRAACEGVEGVVAAAHGLPGTRRNNPLSVDDEGNRALIDASKSAGVMHFVFVSILGARADHVLDFFRFKYQAEERLRRSGLSYTIVRAAAFMETWATIIGEPLLRQGRTTIIGSGKTPINFVSARDVAEYVALALLDTRAKGRVIEVGGPRNYTMVEVADAFDRLRASKGTRKHVPRPVIKALSKILRPFSPNLSRLLSAGVYMDTADQRFDMSETLREFPRELLELETFISDRYRSGGVPLTPRSPGTAARAP